MHTLTLNWRHLALLFGALMAALLLLTRSAGGARLEDLCEVQGARGIPLHGIGLGVRLAGTGDDAEDAIARQGKLLKRLDIESVSARDLHSDIIAVVIEDASFRRTPRRASGLMCASTLFMTPRSSKAARCS